MTLFYLGLVMLAQAALVGGQVLTKHAMNLTHARGRGRAAGLYLAGGVGLLTVWFFVWLGLLQKLPLSFVFPFEGMSPVLLVLAAGVFLRERLGWRAWVGVGLISAGAVLVGVSWVS